MSKGFLKLGFKTYPEPSSPLLFKPLANCLNLGSAGSTVENIPPAETFVFPVGSSKLLIPFFWLP